MPLKPPIRGIFFDAGWTLFRPASNDWFINRAFTSILPSLMSISKERQSTAFSRAMKYLDDNHLLTTEDEELAQFVNFYSILADELPELGADDDLINEAARQKVFGMDNYFFSTTRCRRLTRCAGGISSVLFRTHGRQLTVFWHMAM